MACRRLLAEADEAVWPSLCCSKNTNYASEGRPGMNTAHSHRIELVLVYGFLFFFFFFVMISVSGAKRAAFYSMNLVPVTVWESFIKVEKWAGPSTGYFTGQPFVRLWIFNVSRTGEDAAGAGAGEDRQGSRLHAPPRRLLQHQRQQAQRPVRSLGTTLTERIQIIS